MSKEIFIIIRRTEVTGSIQLSFVPECLKRQGSAAKGQDVKKRPHFIFMCCMFSCILDIFFHNYCRILFYSSFLIYLCKNHDILRGIAYNYFYNRQNP